MRFREEFTVEDHQQLPVTIYDYYEPGIISGLMVVKLNVDFLESVYGSRVNCKIYEKCDII